MKVVATKTGFFKKLREPGDVFEYAVPKGKGGKLVMPSWMEKAPSESKVTEPPEEDEDDPLE